ncbi:hypothetical protein, partial [Celeribacter sp. HF31]|uniref:hypothetical protein n=1 Tax=Celeribacter sp. HF31 TaxID=2721558 RepID=UPI001C375A5A
MSSAALAPENTILPKKSYKIHYINQLVNMFFEEIVIFLSKSACGFEPLALEPPSPAAQTA